MAMKDFEFGVTLLMYDRRQMGRRGVLKNAANCGMMNTDSLHIYEWE